MEEKDGNVFTYLLFMGKERSWVSECSSLLLDLIGRPLRGSELDTALQRAAEGISLLVVSCAPPVSGQLCG